MIKVIELERTCTWCPAQWEGLTECNRLIYIRERHSHLTVRISPVGATDIIEAIDGEFIHNEITETAGGLRFDELLAFTQDKLEFSKDIIKEQIEIEVKIAENFVKVFKK